MPGKDFHPSNAFGDCLREGAWLDDVAAAVDVGEYCAVAGEGSFFLVVVLNANSIVLNSVRTPLCCTPFARERSQALFPTRWE